MDKEALDNAAYEKQLGDIIEIAEDAIYHATGRDESAKAKLYADAIEKIRSSLCWPVVVAKRRSYLDMGDYKLVRLHAGNTTIFVGTRKTEIAEHGMLIEGRCCNLDGLMNTVTVTVNGERVLSASVDGGLHKAERILVGAMHGYNGWKIAGRRHRGGQKGWDQE